MLNILPQGLIAAILSHACIPEFDTHSDLLPSKLRFSNAFSRISVKLKEITGKVE
jgi:hypothetical protein